MLVDFNALDKHYDGDTEILKELVLIFEETYPKCLADLKQATESLDHTNIRLHAHTLKGMVANFFSPEIKEGAYLLEKAGDSQETVNYSELLEKFEVEIPKILIEIRAHLNE